MDVQSSCVDICSSPKTDILVVVLLAFVVLGLVSSILSQEIGREGRLRNDIHAWW